MSNRQTPCPVCGRPTRRVEQSGPCRQCQEAFDWFEDQIDFKDDDKVHGWFEWVPTGIGSPKMRLVRET